MVDTSEKKKPEDPVEGDPPKEMNANAAIINPIFKPAEPRRVLVWSVDQTGNLALAQRSLKGGIDATLTYTAAAEDPEEDPNALRNPSTLSTLVHDDILRVYGVSKKHNKLILVSPIVDHVDSKYTVENGLIAGCSNGDGTKGWVYYVSYDASKQSRFIYEQTVINHGAPANPIKPYGAEKVLEGTNLAAFWDGISRWVVYQRATNLIALRNVSKPEVEWTIGDLPGIAASKTRLAAVFVPGQNGAAQGRVYVYFVSEDKLYRSWAEMTESKLMFSNRTEVEENGGDLHDWAQISAVVDVQNKQNIIYVVKQGGKPTLNHVSDSWAKP